MSRPYHLTFLMAGDAHSMKNGLIPFVSEVERGLDVLGINELKSKYDVGKVFDLKFAPRADAGLIAPIVIGIIAFLGTWATRKFLDEVYEATLRPRVKEYLAPLDALLPKSAKAQPKQLQFGIWYENEKVLVLLIIEGESYNAIASAEPLVSGIHIMAADWIAKHGVRAPVHVYRIAKGQINVEPIPLQTLDDLNPERAVSKPLTITESRPSARSKK